MFFFYFQDDNSRSDIKVKCGNDQEFVYPSTWPTCTDRLNCPKPHIDETVMSYDWDDSIGVTPEYSVTYTCVRPNKLLAPLSDLDSGNEEKIENLVPSLTINCQLNGTYDINMEEWSCTKPCPFPTLVDPEMMQHDWTNNITGPEIFQEVRHSCLNGRKLVSKIAFKTGSDTTLLDDIMSSCQVCIYNNECLLTI